MTRPGWLAEAARGCLVVCLAVLGILATALVVNGDSPVGVLWTRHDSHLYYGVTLAIELAVALFASAVFAVAYWGKGDTRRAVVVLPGTVAHVFLPEPVRDRSYCTPEAAIEAYLRGEPAAVVERICREDEQRQRAEAGSPAE